MRRLFFVVLCLFATPALAAPVVIGNIPAYSWYHGCGPTALGSIFGYYDLLGYDNLFDADGDDVYHTANVNYHLSSDAHNAKYDRNPDDPNLPHPEDTSIADFMHTSEGGIGYGGSYLHYTDDAVTGYAAYRGYEFESTYFSYASYSWDLFTAEIDAGRPLLALVDWYGSSDSRVDHFIPIFGYDLLDDGTMMYACYSTFDEGEHVLWHEYRPCSADYRRGIGYFTTCVAMCDPTPAPVPEPATILLLGCGLVGLASRRRMM